MKPCMFHSAIYHDFCCVGGYNKVIDKASRPDSKLWMQSIGTVACKGVWRTLTNDALDFLLTEITVVAL